MENLASVRRVAHLGVKLDAENRTAAVAYRGHRAGVCGGQWDEIAVDTLHLVAVAHPDDRVFGNADQEIIGTEDVAMSPTELTTRSWLDFAAQHLAGQLHAVTDPQYGNPQVEYFRIAAR